MVVAPKWRQLADDLAARIRSGELAEGDPLPQIRDLTAQGAGSTTTVQAAFRALETEGLVRIIRGKGTYVRRQRPRARREPQVRYPWEKKRALLTEEKRYSTGVTEHDTGLKTPQLQFHAQYDVVEAPSEIAERFGVEPGTRMLQRRFWTTSRDDDAALSLIESWLVYSVAAENPQLLDSGREPWPGGTIHQLRTIGIEVGEIVDTITARPPTTQEAETLDMDPGTAVLVLYKASYDTKGQLVEFSQVVFPGDRHEMVYRVPLEGWDC